MGTCNEFDADDTETNKYSDPKLCVIAQVKKLHKTIKK